MIKSKKATKRKMQMVEVETKEVARIKTINAMESFAKKMQKLGEQEVDLSDENSSFVKLAELNEKYTTFVLKHGSKSGERDLGIRRNIRLPASYPAKLIKAVENFINSKEFKMTWKQPDRNDVYDIVNSHKESLACDVSVDSAAECIFKYIHRKIKSLRKKELVGLHQTHLDQLSSEETPPELNGKLLPEGELDDRVQEYIEGYKSKVAGEEDFSATSGEESDEVDMESGILPKENNELLEPLICLPSSNLNPEVEEITID